MKAAIGGIIKATGKLPDDENRLAEDIEQADIEYALHLRVRSARKGDWRKSLKRVRAELENSAKLIDADPLLKRLAGPSDLPRLVQVLRNIESWADRLAAHHGSKKDRQPTPMEWVAGVALPLVYAERFSARITFDRDDDGNPTGPLIDFIEAAMTALGLRYSQASIARAITRLKTDRDNSRD